MHIGPELTPIWERFSFQVPRQNAHAAHMSNQMDRTIDFGRVFVAIVLPIWAPFGIDLGSIEINLGSIGPHLGLT